MVQFVSLRKSQKIKAAIAITANVMAMMGWSANHINGRVINQVGRKRAICI
jgi:hypothetical protein